MRKYFITRILSLIPIILIVATILFFLIRIAPGSPAATMLGPEATQEEIELYSKRMGLDKPVFQQYITWLKLIIKGDFGKSIFFQGQEVREIVLSHAIPTILLTCISIFYASVIGIIIGLFAAINHGNFKDFILSLISSAGISIPKFWLGLLLVLLFSIKLRWLPSMGYVSPNENLIDFLKFMLLPSITIALAELCVVARLTRGYLCEILETDFIRTAISKGLTKNLIYNKHALKNALVVVITVIGISFGNLMGGTVIAETIFNIPGIGRLLLSAVLTRDYPVLEGVVVFITFMWIAINLIVDLGYALIDPRIRY